jgi:hypothetical protein
MKRIVALLLSVVIMAVIFSRIDLGEFRRSLAQMNLFLFAVGILFFIPQVAISAYRWQVMVRKKVRIGLGESAALVLASNALNILLPSRAGDLSKAYFLGRGGGPMSIKRGMNVVLFEKYIDLASLGIVILTGIVLSPTWDRANLAGLTFSLSLCAIFPVLYFAKLDRWVSAPLFEKNRLLAKVKHFLLDTHDYLTELKGDRRELAFIVGLSVFLWFVHLLQFVVFFRAFHSTVSVFHIFRLVPLAILVGLIPVTIAGVGTRDSAMIYFFSPYESIPLIAGVGVCASLRYFVPGILGLPFLNRYLVRENSVK